MQMVQSTVSWSSVSDESLGTSLFHNTMATNQVTLSHNKNFTIEQSTYRFEQKKTTNNNDTLTNNIVPKERREYLLLEKKHNAA